MTIILFCIHCGLLLPGMVLMFVLDFFLFCLASPFSPLMGSDISQVFNYTNSVEQYKSPGGTAQSSVCTQIKQVHELMKALKD